MRYRSELRDRGMTSLNRSALSGLACASIATLVVAQIDDKTPVATPGSVDEVMVSFRNPLASVWDVLWQLNPAVLLMVPFR